MAKEECLTVGGKVREAFANAQFLVELDSGTDIACHVAGRLRQHFIKIIPGDSVTVEISPYDLTKGRIVYRGRPKVSENGEK